MDFWIFFESLNVKLQQGKVFFQLKQIQQLWFIIVMFHPSILLNKFTADLHLSGSGKEFLPSIILSYNVFVPPPLCEPDKLTSCSICSMALFHFM